MKIVPLFLFASLYVFSPLNCLFAQIQSLENFCANLKVLVESSRNGFYSVKGDSITKMITGSKKKFYLSKIKLIPKSECFINDNPKYPECNCILASDFSISPSLKAEFQMCKTKIVSCFPETDWMITLKDSSNDFYLKGTEFKRLVLVDRNNEKKVKFQLYMYSSMIEKKRIVEILIEGKGRTGESEKTNSNDNQKPQSPANPAPGKQIPQPPKKQ